MKWVWVDVGVGKGKTVVVKVDPSNPSDYTCTCDDPRHLYPNKYPGFRCRCWAIAMERIKNGKVGNDL